MSSFYEEVNGVRVHYEKVGRGEKVLLLIHGIVSSSRAGFSQQLDGGLNQDLFTLIAVDIPGWGKSRPPERNYTIDVYKRDAVTIAGLMSKLGYSSYSICGWSYGSIVGVTMASSNPNCVEKLISIGGPAFVGERIIEALTSVRKIDNFEPRARSLTIEIYGKELAQELWTNEVNFWLKFAGNDEPTWDLRDEMRSLKCPALIIHGAKDKLIDKSHGQVASNEIPNARLVMYPDGSHDVHQVFVSDCNKTITNFLLGSSSS